MKTKMFVFEMKWAKQQSIIEAEREEERKTALCCLNDSHYSQFLTPRPLKSVFLLFVFT